MFIQEILQVIFLLIVIASLIRLLDHSKLDTKVVVWTNFAYFSSFFFELLLIFRFYIIIIIILLGS
jgi:hypothetical protein